MDFLEVNESYRSNINLFLVISIIFTLDDNPMTKVKGYGQVLGMPNSLNVGKCARIRKLVQIKSLAFQLHNARIVPVASLFQYSVLSLPDAPRLLLVSGA
jgi:hypothetical protein